MKRLARVIVSHGQGVSSSDKMFAISLIANLIKRHPRTVRLIHRKKKLYALNPTFETDPYLDCEKDPSKAKALKSSLWEIDAILQNEMDEQVRNYCKLFKADLSRKTNFFKCEEFALIDPLDQITEEINSMDLAKESAAIQKSILLAHDQWKAPVLKKRVQVENIDLNPTNSKNMRLGEKYTKDEEFF